MTLACAVQYPEYSEECDPNGTFLFKTNYNNLLHAGQRPEQGFACVLGNRIKTPNGVKCQVTLFAQQQNC